MVPEAGRAEEAQRAAGLKKVPLDGFMGEADWNGVCLEMRTRGGVFWPIPVTLSASDQQPVFRQLLLEAQQALLVPGLHRLADQSRRCDKANGAAFLAGRPRPRATWVLPVPLLPSAMPFSRRSTYSQRAGGTAGLA